MTSLTWFRQQTLTRGWTPMRSVACAWLSFCGIDHQARGTAQTPGITDDMLGICSASARGCTIHSEKLPQQLTKPGSGLGMMTSGTIGATMTEGGIWAIVRKKREEQKG